MEGAKQAQAGSNSLASEALSASFLLVAR